jgi:hypothetical protein
MENQFSEISYNSVTAIFLLLIFTLAFVGCSVSDENNLLNKNSSSDTIIQTEETQISIDDEPTSAPTPTVLVKEEPLTTVDEDKETNKCLLSNLSIEELAHCGTHAYSVHNKVESGSCTFSNGEKTHEIQSVELVFDVNEDGFFNLGSSGIQKYIDERTGPNTYEIIVLKSDGEYYGTLYQEFYLTGFIVEEHDEIDECVFTREYTLIE